MMIADKTLTLIRKKLK